jgi:acyl-CoA thioester hydrolase
MIFAADKIDRPEEKTGKKMGKQLPAKDTLSAAQDRVVSEARVKVRYAETDQMGFAYYANYLVWFEVGRSQYCNDRGFSYRDMELETGLFLTVAEARCRYRSPARYEDELTIKTWISDLTRRTVRFMYEITRAGGESVAVGETTHVLSTPQGRPSSFPEKFMALLRNSDA